MARWHALHRAFKSLDTARPARDNFAVLSEHGPIGAEHSSVPDADEGEADDVPHSKRRMKIPRLRHRKVVLVGIGSVLAIFLALDVATTALVNAHGDLLTVLMVISFVLAAIFGTVLALGLVAAVWGIPVLVLVGAARLFGKASGTSINSASSIGDSPR